MKLLHLYYDLMNLYGEYANMAVSYTHLSTGTGFAQPKPNSRIHRAPIGSMEGRGFNVSLPRFFAVESPIRYATQA